MVFPVTLSNVYFPDNNSFVGPKQINNKTYLVLRDNTSLSKLVVLEASNPEIGWTKKAAIDLGTNKNLLSWWVEDWGSNLHIAAMTHDGNTPDPHAGVHYLVYNTVTDTYDINILVTDIKKNGPYHEVANCSLALRDTGDPVVIYNGKLGRVHGRFYERLYIAFFDGISWVTDVPLDGDGQVDWVGGIAKSGNNARVHFVFKDLTNNDLYQRTLRANNQLEPLGAPVDSALDAIPHVAGRGVSFFGGSVKVRIPYRDSNSKVSVLEFDSSDNPVITINTNITDNAIQVYRSSIVACMTNNGSDQYLVYGDLQNTGMYLDVNPNETTWGVDVLKQALGALRGVSCEVYDRGGLKIGVVYLDGQSVKFTEIV